MSIQKADIPTWGLFIMLASSLVGIYFLSRDLISRF